MITATDLDRMEDQGLDQVSFRIPTPWIKQLDTIAGAQDRSRTYLLRQIIRDYLAGRPEKSSTS